MKFTEKEISFILRPDAVEHAAGRRVHLPPNVDLRQLGCPDSVFEPLLEQYARKLGSRFIEFRSLQHSVPVVADDLDARIEVCKLF